MAGKKNTRKTELMAAVDKDTTKRNLAVNYCSFAAATGVTLFIGFLLSFVKTEVDYEAISNAFFYDNISALTSQISRTIQYFVCSVGFVLLYALFYYLFNKKIKKDTFSQKVNTVVHFVTLGVLAFLAIYLNLRSEARFFETLTNSIFGGFFSILLVIVGFLITLYFAFGKFTDATNGIGGIVGIIVCVAFILSVAYVHVVNSFYQNNSGEYFHCEVVYHSIHQLYSGHTPLVDFTSTYGLFVYLYLPFELLLGGVTMFNTSLVSSFFMLISMLCFMYCAFKMCKNKVVATVTAMAMTAVSIMNISASWFTDPKITYLYWQYTPIRMLFPSIVLALCCASLSGKKKKLVSFLRYALSGIAFWANLETGIACLATSVAFDVYSLLLEHGFKDRVFWKNTGKSFLKAVLSVAAATAIVVGVTLLHSGQLPNLRGIITDHMWYAKTGGFFQSEIDFFEIWLLVVIVYAILIAKSLRDILVLRNNKHEMPDSRSVMYFVTAFMGVCLFVYYVGRDSHVSLMHSAYPAVLGVGMLVQEYCSRIIERRKQKEKKSADGALDWCKFLSGFVCLFVAVSLSVALLVNPDYFENGKKKPQTDPASPLAQSLEFINTHYDAERDGKIDIFLYNTSTLYTELGMKNHLTFPQLEEWYYRYDIYRRAEEYLSTTENYILIYRTFLEMNFEQYITNAYDRGITDNPDFINWLLNERCEIVAQNDFYLLLKPITE